MKLPQTASIPWDFSVVKILILGMANGRWGECIRDWVGMVMDARVATEKDEEEVWWRRIRGLEELIVFAWIEIKVFRSSSVT
jgi:hypothetical protein